MYLALKHFNTQSTVRPGQGLLYGSVLQLLGSALVNFMKIPTL